ncbi:hypothetical protein ACHAXN_010426 [Cyclotella atomus]
MLDSGVGMQLRSGKRIQSSFRPFLILRLVQLIVFGICLYIIFAVNQCDDVTPLPGGPSSLKAQTRAAHQNDNSLEMSSKRRSRALSDAANTLRCFTMPGCYPSIRCADGAEPLQIPVYRSWEQQAFCTGDLAAEKLSKCLVYSFGINDNTEWETKIAKEFGCEVFAFDPTSKFKQDVAPGVTFHQLGLHGAGVDVSKTHSESYDALDPTKMKSLGEIIKLMGHEGRKIDILRLDCEGCEHGVLKEMACSGESKFVQQLMVEFHFQKNLGLATEDDVLVAADAITCLESERWAIASMEISGCGPKDAAYTQSALKFVKAPYFLAYITLKKLPDNARWSWDLYGDYIVEEAQQHDFFASNYGKHGADVSKWPEDMRSKYDELGKGKEKIMNVYKPMFGEITTPKFSKYGVYQLREG